MPSVRSPHRLHHLESVVVFFLTFVLAVFTVHANEELSSICQGAQNCGECISVNPECTWCTEDTFQGRRCDLESLLQEAGCSNITNPLPSADATQDDPLSEANADLDAIVQVRPQRMKIKVRPREPIDIRLYVRQAADYPVDLYYAMDLSNSMGDDLENLKGLGTTLSEALKSITRDFRLGFGSFVDKRILPYIRTVPDRLIFPCPKSSESCARTHGFYNALPLNQDPELFANLIANTIISGNLDTPEGGFDALMQIAVCGNIIGWRPKARHLVIFTTDASFHIAGDGRIAGIMEPNDGQCHMDPDTNMYTLSTLQDYPSIGHLSAKLRENNVIPIFAVTMDQTSLYMKLENYIEGATVGTLDSDSGNIVQLIQSNYDRITSQVRLTSTAPEDVTLSYRANCKDQTYEDTNECSGLKLEDTVSFDITITAERCVEGGLTSFNIGPVGFNEELKIELEVTCECDCQGLGANSNVCSNGNGTLVCGECACNPGRYGVMCECSGNEISVESTDTSPCRTGNATRTCSGRGECICGKCVCDNTRIPGEVISGQFCECDNFNCPYSRGLRCGGPDQGMCVCDVATRQPKCECKPGFKGDSCDCPTRKDTCRASNGLECNARGTCECGVCECTMDSQFQGKTCERCITCPSGNCLIHKDCVQCTVFGSGRLTPEQCGMCSIDIVNVTSIDEYTKDNPTCDFMLNDSCTFRFVVVSENETVTVYVEGEATCITPPVPRGPPLTPTEIRWTVIGIILGIVLIGIILVCAWRLYINAQDRREYAQWKKESQKPKWVPRDNEIYLAPISRHENPLHIGNQK